MSGSVELEDITVKPVFDRSKKAIHPVIGVVDDVAYVGIWIPSLIIDKEGREVEKDLLYLITDRHKAILANDEVLSGKGWKLSYKPIHFENRWPLDDVKAYLSEKESSVDPVKVLQHVLEVWQAYMEMPSPEEYLYEALWDIGSYFHHLFNSYPYRYIGGTKRVGKSKDLTLHYCLALNAIFSNNMSISSIYRLIQNARTTLLIDETEKLSNPERAQGLRSILLAGYKYGEKVYRVEKNRKEQLVPEAFEVYSPKCIANITGIEDVLEDRCKVTFLKRSINKAIADKEIDIRDSKWSELRSELYRFYLAFWREVEACYDRTSEHDVLVNMVDAYTPNLKDDYAQYVTARELELWRPILSLAIFFDEKCISPTMFTGPLCSLVLRLAVSDAKQKHIENITETGELILVQTLPKKVTADSYYKVRDIKAAMAASFDEEPTWLSIRWVGNALRRLGFKEKRRVGTGYEYRLNPDVVKDLAERMGVAIRLVNGKPLKVFEEMKESGVCELCSHLGAKWLASGIVDNKKIVICDTCKSSCTGKEE